MSYLFPKTLMSLMSVSSNIRQFRFERRETYSEKSQTLQPSMGKIIQSSELHRNKIVTGRMLSESYFSHQRFLLNVLHEKWFY